MSLKAFLLPSLTAFLLAPAAFASVHAFVTLNDGSAFYGELIEKVEGDQVTLRLSTGKVKTFKWKDIQKTDIETDQRQERSTPSDIIEGWPEPDRAGSASGWGTLTTPDRYARFGLGSTLGSLGTIGVFGVVNFSPAFGSELGVNFDGGFGTSLSAMLRGGIEFVPDFWKMGIGIGYEEAFLNRAADIYGYPGAPSEANFLNFEFYNEFAVSSAFALRLGFGFWDLLNANQYAGMQCPAGNCAPALGANPWTIAQYQQNGLGGSLQSFIKLSVIWSFE